jgi:hypothetical protein
VDSFNDVIKASFVIIVLVAYFLAVIPHIVHSSFRDAGEVVGSTEINRADLPRWLEPHVARFGEGGLALLRVSHAAPNVTYAIITDEPKPVDTLVEIESPMLSRVTEWRTFGFVEFEFDEFMVGEVEAADGGFFRKVETFLYYSAKSPLVKGLIRFLSTVAWLVGPILAMLYLPYLLFGRIHIWQIVGVIWLYSYSLLFLAILSGGQVALSAVLFLALGILTVHLWRYETSQRGRETIDRIWSRRRRLPDRL